MRKVFGLVCAVLFVAGISSVARAQDLSFGVKAGLGLADFTNVDETEIDEYGGTLKIESERITGAALGGFVEYKINDNFLIQPEVLYTQKGTEASFVYSHPLLPDDITDKCKIKLTYIEIPVLAKYSISPGESVCPFIFGGPALGILVSVDSDKIDGETVVEKDDCESIDIGLVFGGGVELESGVSIDLRYDMGLTKVFDYEGEEETGNEKNTVISLMVGYKLPIE